MILSLWQKMGLYFTRSSLFISFTILSKLLIYFNIPDMIVKFVFEDFFQNFFYDISKTFLNTLSKILSTIFSEIPTMFFNDASNAFIDVLKVFSQRILSAHFPHTQAYPSPAPAAHSPHRQARLHTYTYTAKA